MAPQTTSNNPLTAKVAIAAINAGIALIESLLPVIQRLRLAGEVSVDEQREVLGRYQSLKERADGQFKGPEWQIEP
jgi:hypothetical protein